MQRVVNLARSSVGKKILMAASGTILFLFLIGHMAGNLKMLQGCDPATGICAMDTYAEFLREVGYPAVPKYSLLWLARIGLLAAVGVHIVAAFQLWQKSRKARSKEYRKEKNISFSYASRTMRWGGVIIAAFIVYHILHFTTGTVHTDYVKGEVYANFVVAFQRPLVWIAYLVAQTALALHLYHGLWSATQTLGANHPKYNHLRRPAALALTLLIFVGFLTPPTLVLAGVIS